MRGGSHLLARWRAGGARRCPSLLALPWGSRPCLLAEATSAVSGCQEPELPFGSPTLAPFGPPWACCASCWAVNSPSRPLAVCTRLPHRPDRYHKQLDVTAPLLKCRTLPELKALLASLAAEGRLAQLAGSLQRNLLSFIVRRPPVEPCTQVRGRPGRCRCCGPRPPPAQALAHAVHGNVVVCKGQVVLGCTAGGCTASSVLAASGPQCSVGCRGAHGSTACSGRHTSAPPSCPGHAGGAGGGAAALPPRAGQRRGGAAALARHRTAARSATFQPCHWRACAHLWHVRHTCAGKAGWDSTPACLALYYPPPPPPPPPLRAVVGASRLQAGTPRQLWAAASQLCKAQPEHATCELTAGRASSFHCCSGCCCC